MATMELTAQNLNETIENNDILLIDFWSDWCPPCKIFGPVFEKASEEHEEMTFAQCNTEKQQEVAGAFGIRSIPTLAVFKEQVLVFMQPGALPAEALDEILQKVRELDMDEVRKEIAEQEEKEGSAS